MKGGTLMKAIDFTNCELAYKVYGGAERKMGIIYDSSIYMLKFLKKTDTTMRLDLSYTNSIFSVTSGNSFIKQC